MDNIFVLTLSDIIGAILIACLILTFIGWIVYAWTSDLWNKYKRKKKTTKCDHVWGITPSKKPTLSHWTEMKCKKCGMFVGGIDICNEERKEKR